MRLPLTLNNSLIVDDGAISIYWANMVPEDEPAPYIITAAEDLVEMGKAPGIYEEYDDIDEAVLKYLEHIGKLKQKCP